MSDEEIRYRPTPTGQVSIGFRGLLAKYGASDRLTQASGESGTGLPYFASSPRKPIDT